MRAVDEYIPTPERETEKPFLMPIEDVFSIKGRGTVVTGRIERGTIKPMEEVGDRGVGADTQDGGDGCGDVPQAAGQGHCGRQCGLSAARHRARDDVERGQVLAKPGSITPHTEFMAEVYVLKKEEGGRHTPFFKGYRPQFYIRTMDITGID